ncbi:MAG: alpha/beta fold hydrolase [Thermoleophilaceae bacterium]
MSSTPEPDRGPAPRPRRFYTDPEWLRPGGDPVAVRRSGSGPPLLFLHGASFSRMWLPFHERLAEELDVIAPEHPGYGETPRSPRVGSMDDLALVYHEMLDELGLERAHLAGWSLGGWLAALMAAERPERALSLSLLTPAGLSAPGAADTPDLSDPEALWDAMFVDRSHRDEVMPDYDDPDEVAQLEFEGETRVGLSHGATADEELERRVAAVTVPSLVVGAERDLIVPDGVADRYAEVIPDARLVRVPGTGHGLIIERPEEVARLVVAHAVGA